MIQHQSRHSSSQVWAKPVALLLVGSMTLPTLGGCGSQQSSAPPPTEGMQGQRPPGMGQPPRPGMAQQKPGMSSGQKKMIALAGAAALYYMYKKKRDANNKPTNVQYYLSKNGRIYYRDPQSKQAIYVTAPRQAFQVPENEAAEYRQFQGYNNNPSGRSNFNDLIPMQ